MRGKEVAATTRGKSSAKLDRADPAPEGQATYAMANLRPERAGLPLPKLRKADLPGPYNSVFLLFSNIHTHPNSVIGELKVRLSLSRCQPVLSDQ